MFNKFMNFVRRSVRKFFFKLNSSQVTPGYSCTHVKSYPFFFYSQVVLLFWEGYPSHTRRSPTRIHAKIIKYLKILSCLVCSINIVLFSIVYSVINLQQLIICVSIFVYLLFTQRSKIQLILNVSIIHCLFHYERVPVLLFQH